MLRERINKRLHRIMPPHAANLFIILVVLSVMVTLTTYCFHGQLRMRSALLWNMFLAGLPLLFALVIYYFKDGKFRKLVFVPAGLLWLGFFPNAPYMLTDIIHFSRYTFYERSIGFVPDPVSWFGLLHLGTGVLVGCVSGLLSLYILHSLIEERFGKNKGWIFAFGVAVLTSIAIYLGRFLRFNTWDLIANPSVFADGLDVCFSFESLLLYLIFFFMTIIPYSVFYACIKR